MVIIFVAGIHGVGKTSTCEQAIVGTSWIHKSASSIIREEKESAIKINSKRVTDVPGNQTLLLTGLQKLTLNSNCNLLLDGHFTLLSEDGKIVRIDQKVFKELDLNGIILIVDTPERIRVRQSGRDSIDIKTKHIAQHQKEEKEHALAVASALSTPIYTVAAFDSEALAKLLESLA